MKFRTLTCLIAAFSILISGCTWIEENPKTSTGAAVGAAAGGVAGAMYKGTKGAVIGGVLGALAGASVGKYLDEKKEDEEETKEQFNYNPEQGMRLEMQSAEVNPQTVSPGDEVKLKATYAVMTPELGQEVQVRETRVVTLNGEKVADTTTQIPRKSGTYSSTLPIDLPQDVETGKYEYTVTVEAGDLEKDLSTTFFIQD